MQNRIKLPHIIDLHTHVFNANYVPLEEILVSKKVPKRLAKILTKLILALTGKSRLETPEILDVKPLGGEEDLFDLASDLFVYGLADSLSFDTNKGTWPDGVFDNAMTVLDSPLYETIVEIDREFGDESSGIVLDCDAFIEHAVTVVVKDRKDFNSKAYKRLNPVKRMLNRFLKMCLRYVEETGNTLDFLVTMMRSENPIYHRLTSYYDKYNISYQLVHHMMDMDHPFGGNSEFDFYEKQIPKMAALEHFSSGLLIGFSAFDPIRFTESHSPDLKQSIEDCLDYSMSHRKAGFKFYPPMGYRAAGNEISKKLEVIVNIFFDYCLNYDIPIFTHCTPAGFEVVSGESGSNSHPKFWARALEKNPLRKNLRICFGHGGGGTAKHSGRRVYGWMANNEEQWMDEDNYARQVVELCRLYPNVYCELAYLDEIIHSRSKRSTFVERLRYEYSKDDQGDMPYTFQEKVMYGSDWHMPSMVNDIDRYFEILRKIFKSLPFSNHSERFFYQNAQKYLKIEP